MATQQSFFSLYQAQVVCSKAIVEPNIDQIFDSVVKSTKTHDGSKLYSVGQIYIRGCYIEE